MQEGALIIFELRDSHFVYRSPGSGPFLLGCNEALIRLDIIYLEYTRLALARRGAFIIYEPRYTLFEVERYVKWLEIICSRAARGAKESETCARITTLVNVIFVRQSRSNRTTCRDAGKARAIRRSVCDLAQLQSRDSVDLARSGGGLRKGVGRYRYHLWTHPPTGLCLVADDSRRLVLGIH